MKILEGSDTLLEFHITEKEYTDGVLTNETDKDLTQYDKVILSIKYYDWIVDYEGVVQENTSHVIFTLLSEDTKDKCGSIQAEIWGVKNDNIQKNRLNETTIEGEILHSFKIPQWTVND